MNTSELISWEYGSQKVVAEGVTPFFRLVESEGSFLQAKCYVEMYDLLFRMCIQREPFNYTPQAYELYTACIIKYLNEYALPDILNHKTGSSGEDIAFLRRWTQRWERHKSVVMGMFKIFMYVNRFYVQNTQRMPLQPHGFSLYRTHVFDKLCDQARDAIVRCINRERRGEEQDRVLLKQSVGVFVELGFSVIQEKLRLYEVAFHGVLVENAKDFYRRKASEWLEQDSCSVYLEKAEKALVAERSRCDAFLENTTTPLIVNAVAQQLLRAPHKELLAKQTGLDDLLRRNATEDLARLYRLYKDFNEEREHIAVLLFEHVRAEGTELLNKTRAAAAAGASGVGGAGAGAGAGASGAGASGAGAGAGAGAASGAGMDVDGGAGAAGAGAAGADGANGSAAGAAAAGGGGGGAAPASDAGHTLVRNLILLHGRYAEIVIQCFNKDQDMQKSLKKAFDDFINQDNMFSKQLARFVNDILRKGSKVNVRDIESTLDNVVFLYGYIQEKDVFEREYQVYLSHRLLNGLCESEHSEKSMISKLKTQCGYQWTNKLEGMFKDVQLSKELMTQFKSFTESQAAASSSSSSSSSPSGESTGRDDEVQLEVNVCTTGYWPSNKALTCRMPLELAMACDTYKAFYLNSHSGHKLAWRFDQGQAELLVDFSPTCRKTLVVSTYQMLILLVFNSFKVVSFKELLDHTNLPRYEILNHLMSLYHPKVKVLEKKPDGKKIEDAHKFRLNPEYKNSLRKITVPLLRLAEVEENDEEMKAIELQRRHQIDAAIVRIMKTRKKFRHMDLVTEVINQLKARFLPRPNDIKKRIEAMIEQEYMERDTKDRSEYHYKA